VTDVHLGLPWYLQVAHDEQMYGSRLVRIEDGSGEGARLLEVWTPAGLHIDFMLDRAFDIHTVRFGGRPISWMGPSGIKRRHQHEPTGFGWLRTFHGGLVVTCGLEHFGSPATRDASEFAPPDRRRVEFGEHGRISHQGASLARCEVEAGADPAFVIVGQVRQAALYGEQYVLRREYRLPLLRPEISLVDTVTNVGPLPTRHVLVYHMNFGYPLVDAPAMLTLDTDAGRIESRYGPLGPSTPEEVTAHRLLCDEEGWAEAAFRNPDASLSATLAYDTSTLPVLYVWKLARERANVLGLSPASHLVPDDADPLEADGRRTYRWRLRIGA
jgi:hypothetical protein